MANNGKQQDIFLSVVTAAFNSECFINRLYSSLERQKIKSFEWIVVDDSSSDSTVELIKNIKLELSFTIRAFALPVNSGGSVALSFGIQKAKGKYILLVDHDDALTDDAIETIINDISLIEHNDKLSGIFYRSINPSTGKINGKSEIKGTIYSFSKKVNMYRNPCDGLMLVKSDVLRRFYTPQYAEKICLNGPIWLKMSQKYPVVSAGNKALLIYHRDNPSSQTLDIKLSRKTVFSYAEILNNADIWYLLRPIYYIRLLANLVAISDYVHGTKNIGLSYLRLPIIKYLGYMIAPFVIFYNRYFRKKKNKIIDYKEFPLHLLDNLKEL